MTPAWIHSRIKRSPFAAVPVVAHLRHQAGFLGHAGHDAGFLDAVGHRLFHVDVLAGPQGRQG